ncbi:MAG: hypothetical protein IT285_14710 [Bdellovibrionales bacterium]|nr:hypothetical protein [Bdellovibrionales bacterium]
MVLLTGYDPVRRRYRFRNSWGPSWGDSGTGTMPESYVMSYCEICPYLGDLDSISAEEREFRIQSARGVSGRLQSGT